MPNRYKVKYTTKSKEMRNIYRVAKNIATSNVNVLISGESGTGKSFLAKFIHSNSSNVGNFSILDTVVFNQMDNQKIEEKLIENIKICQKGTLLINNIAEASLYFQSTLVTIILSNEENNILQDVRFIASTNRNLSELVRQGRFRQDLYDILSVVSIEIPPLKSRKEDIELLIETFLSEFDDKKYTISTEVLNILQKYDWPGNIRELKNITTQVALSSEDGNILPNLLPSKVSKKNPLLLPNAIVTDELYKLAKGLIESGKHIETLMPYNEYLKIVEKPLIQAAMDEVRGNKSEAAKSIKINRNTLSKKILELGIE